MKYPIYIEVPEDYWTYSCTIIADSSEENTDK